MESSPRHRRRQQTRQAILAAARELTRANGPTGWTMRDLADRIDYTTTATYRYFESKDAVLAAVVDDTLAALADELERRAEASRSPGDAVLEVALAYIEFARRHPTDFRLAFVELQSRRTSFDQAPDSGSAYAVLLAAVEAAVEHQVLAVTESLGPEQIAYIVWSAAHGMATLEITHLRAFAPDLPASQRYGLERLLDGLASA